jgi:hypothetical protein
MAFDTRESLSEREVSFQTMNKFGLNPFSFKILAESYMRNIYPNNFAATVELSSKGQDKMDVRSVSFRKVYIEMRAPGKVAARSTSEGLDLFGLKTACLSYYMNMRPKPLSFLFSGIEIHLRTPGVSEGDYKNPMRNILMGKK